MKLLILFVLLIAFSVLCSMIFTNPNKHSKCCEAPADQPIIGIFGVCLYLLGMAILAAAFFSILMAKLMRSDALRFVSI